MEQSELKYPFENAKKEKFSNLNQSEPKSHTGLISKAISRKIAS